MNCDKKCEVRCYLNNPCEEGHCVLYEMRPSSSVQPESAAGPTVQCVERNPNSVTENGAAAPKEKDSEERGWQELYAAMDDLQESIRKTLADGTPFVMPKNALFIVGGAKLHLQGLRARLAAQSATTAMDQYPDVNADGDVFCGKCGHRK